MPDQSSVSTSVMSFLNQDSMATAIKAIIAWQAKPGVSAELIKLGVPDTWLTHEMAVFAAVLWGIDRLHRLYKSA